MNAEEIERVTGFKWHSKQVEWFKAQLGTDVVRCSDGSPVVTWATFEALQARKAGLNNTPAPEQRPPLRALRAVK